MRVSGRRGRTGRLALHGRSHAVTHGGPPPRTPRRGSANLPEPGAAGKVSVGDPCQHHPLASPPASLLSPWPMGTTIAGGKGLVPAPPRAPLGTSPPGFAGWEARASSWCAGLLPAPQVETAPTEPGTASQGCLGWRMGSEPILVRLRVPWGWSRRTSPRMLTGSAQMGSIRPNCTNTARGWLPCTPGMVRQPHQHPIPGASAGARIPPLYESPAQPFPSPGVLAWGSDPKPLLSQQWTEPARAVRKSPICIHSTP